MADDGDEGQEEPKDSAKKAAPKSFIKDTSQFGNGGTSDTNMNSRTQSFADRRKRNAKD